jgi:gluconokinase
MSDSAPTVGPNDVLPANSADTALVPSALQHRWIWVVIGPTASGKTGIAKALASELDFPFIEGDDVSPLSHSGSATKQRN